MIHLKLWEHLTSTGTLPYCIFYKDHNWTFYYKPLDFLGLSAKSRSQSGNMQMQNKRQWQGSKGGHQKETVNSSHWQARNVRSEEYRGSEEAVSLPLGQYFSLSYWSEAKNYTCLIVSLFQGILWIWNFICLVSIHHVLSVKFQLLSV